MNILKQSSFFALIIGLSLFASCGDDDSSTPESSATLEIDNKTYTKASDSEITYVDFSFNDESSYSVGGDVVNGTDTVNFSISLPNIDIATYTKSSNDSEVSVSVDFNSSFYDSDVFGFSDVEDMTDYTVRITSKTESTITGEFTATLQDSSTDETIEVSGDFVAVDLSVILEDFFN